MKAIEIINLAITILSVLVVPLIIHSIQERLEKLRIEVKLERKDDIEKIDNRTNVLKERINKISYKIYTIEKTLSEIKK